MPNPHLTGGVPEEYVVFEAYQPRLPDEMRCEGTTIREFHGVPDVLMHEVQQVVNLLW